MVATDSARPRLRAVDVRQTQHNGQPCLVLRDPLQLAEGALIVSQQVGPLLALCDGTRDRAELRAELRQRYGLLIDADLLDGLLRALDEALLLDNGRFAAARAEAVAAYRRAPHRPLSFADQIYPADPHELRRMLDGYLDGAAGIDFAPAGRGILSPHIDYARGGPVYGAVWRRAAEWINEVDLVVLFGTDHYGGGRLTLTRQHYATPYGILPTPVDLVDRLAAALGPQAMEGELLHCGEHAIELVAVWLHHMRGGQPCELLPVLCGSFADFTRGGARPADDPMIGTLLETLRSATAGRRVAFVASGDLAHVGPAFGGAALGPTQYARLRDSDGALIERLGAGDAEGFLGAVRAVRDRNNICGLPPTYLLLRALGETRGECVAYAQCPADDYDTSAVSVAGVVFQ
ncbi:MAG TPA: AmmeMemoRadiSam system protein B [Roseiflexaceae bacterium]|nr:AmmeMemoRadiSam system protein B [Roseiflexaceae bacterium]